MATITIGVLALQGGVDEHLSLLRRAAPQLSPLSPNSFDFIQVRTNEELSKCDALIIPGGESTTMSIVAKSLGLLDPLRDFVNIQRKPVWGTCAGLVMLAEQASAVKKGGQDLIGGLDVKVIRNRYGTQIQSFVADLRLPFLAADDDDGLSATDGGGDKPFRGVFIRAPVVEAVNIIGSLKGGGEEGLGRGGEQAPVEVMGVYRRGAREGGDGGEAEEDIVAVRQRNVFGTSFHPELTSDIRIHVWWLKQVLDAVKIPLN